MNARRWSNITAARRAHEAGSTVTSEAPIEAFLEIAARCNIRCQMCAINYDSRYQPGSGRPPFFGPDLFARLRPIFPSLSRAQLFGLGEPLLNRHLPDYVRELSNAGVEVGFNTNATLIDDQRAEELAIAGAARIHVSIDGATASTYEEIRRGATFAAVTRGIRALVEAGRRHGRPIVDLSFVGMKSNIEELPMLVDLCAELGATGVHVEPLYSQPTSSELDEHYARENLGLLPQALVAKAFDDAIERAGHLDLRFSSRYLFDRSDFDYREAARRQRLDWMCSEPWASIWVTSAGEVRTCCTNETSFGNLFDQPIEEIWNGDAFRHFRAQHARGEAATGCGNCLANGRLRHSWYFRTLEGVTYHPLFRELPRPSPADVVVIDTPVSGATVTDPLVITGKVADPAEAEFLELMIDSTSVANFNAAAYFHDAQFVLPLAAGFLTEGAHTIWVRHRLRPDDGCAHREVFVWREWDCPAAVATDEARLVCWPPRVTIRRPQLHIDGAQWDAAEWTPMWNGSNRLVLCRARLSSLEPGVYDAEIRSGRRMLQRFRLRRVPAGQ